MKREEQIFEQAIALASPGARESYLIEACGDDRDLRRRVDELLGAFQDAGQIAFLQTGDRSDAIPTLLATPLAEGPGSVIDRYKLLQKIGEGGMGVVYMAEQEQPVRRRVALKIIKLGMDTKQVVARFEAERQALALMDHPNIARVLDGGATEAGRLYFVMELVQGVPITEFCDTNRLPARERIKLFIAVCQAIQSAHQKGIIHRDIKPTNILVTLNVGVPVPKVIDFGVAKATNQKLTEKTLFTHYATMIGTPAYMSPEQAEMTSLDVDTRTDIYSLGVLLYELLTGTTPFPEKRLRSVGYGEMQRIIAEEEPERPSTRLSTMTREQRSVVAKNRGATELALGKAFASDLDWIVMKCLEKDRGRRYEAANDLARDLDRHLNNEPILARPPSPLYQLQKFARRNKVVFAGVAVGAVALVAGASLATIGFLQARTQRDQANHARLQALDGERNAREQELLARQRAYTSDMNLVQQAWGEGNPRREQALLRAQNPKPGERDLRGFEWRYLWKLCHDESRLTFTNFPARVTMALSPGGSFVAASSGRIVRLLDYVSGLELDTLLDPNDTNTITALAFSPAGTNVLATASGKKLNLWSLAEKQVTSSITLSNSASALAFSRDGGLMAAAGGNDATLELWDVGARKLIWTRKASREIDAVAFTPDGTSLLSNGGGSSCNPLLWDLGTGAPTPFPVEHKARANSFEFSRDGRLLATGANDSTVILWDFAERRPLARLVGHNGPVNSAKLSPDGHYLATGGADATVRLWDVTSREQMAVYRGHEGEVNSVAFSADGRSVISSSSDRTVKVWDVKTPLPYEVLPAHKNWAGCVEFSPDGKRLASVDLHEGVLTIWDVATRSRIADLTRSSVREAAAAFSPDGETLALVGEDRLIRLWDAATLTPRGVLTNDFDMISLSFAPDSRILAVSGLPGFNLQGITNRLAFWNLAARQKINKLASAEPLAVIVSFSHDGRLVAIGYLNGEVRIWDFDTERLVTEFKDQSHRIWSVAFNPDDTWLAAGGEDGAVVFYDVRARRAFKPLTQSSWWLMHLAFAPDGKTLASAEGDGTVKLWNVATRQSALTLKGHIGAVASVAFSRDGRLMASCGADGSVHLWPAPSFEEIEKVEMVKAPTR